MPLFYPDDAPAPQELRTGEFILRPLRASHNPLDYDAVMESKDQLRLGSLHGWPRDGFTTDENLADLRCHEQDFAERRGFTYTILTPDETRCLGCLYLYPLDSMLRQYSADAEAIARVGDFEAHAYFWVRSSSIPGDLDRRVLTAVRTWLRREFAFSRIVFGVQSRQERHVVILRDGGLRLVGAYTAATGQHLLFEE
jgi:hypothetical protein